MFSFNTTIGSGIAYAQVLPQASTGPSIAYPTPPFTPIIIKGIKIFPDEPFRFNFIVDSGDSDLKNEELENESKTLIKYFLTTLTVPGEDLWVNLSFYEKNRIMPENFGRTVMGRDMLAQDYLLKQLTSSLLYPEGETGEKFWEQVYSKIYERYGKTDIPEASFKKIWIVPGKAQVYEHNDSAFITESYMKVMLEEDFEAVNKNKESLKIIQSDNEVNGVNDIARITNQVMRETVIPEIEKEINSGKGFIKLRQIYNSMIMASWFKRNLRRGILKDIYFGQSRVGGVD
ncbi:MAG: hypothetical protein HQL27_09455, partial [Candidatus Omnitrophica bacterium]|nr:hypothetical protein [Candidatus Omnitrophota bacterium]